MVNYRYFEIGIHFARIDCLPVLFILLFITLKGNMAMRIQNF